MVDALIALSVEYEALDDLGAYQRWFDFQPITKIATLSFGFIHGTGLATKVLDYQIAPNGLFTILLAFNLGGGLRQIVALSVILVVMGFWRRTNGFFQHAYTVNVVMISLGFILAGYQMVGYFLIG